MTIGEHEPHQPTPPTTHPMTAHDHAERVQGCFRCDLSHDETARAQVEALAEATGSTVDEVERSAASLVEAILGTKS